jgi:hypothetical protein
MNQIFLEGTAIRILLIGKTIPYWFPINSTLVQANPANDGLFFSSNDVQVECKFAVSGLPGGSPFASMAAMATQIGTWVGSATEAHTTIDEESFLTSATGATYVTLANIACAAIQIYNDSVADIEIRRGANTKTLKCFKNSYVVVDGITNANQLSVRRLDVSNTQLTVVYSYLR